MISDKDNLISSEEFSIILQAVKVNKKKKKKKKKTNLKLKLKIIPPLIEIIDFNNSKDSNNNNLRPLNNKIKVNRHKKQNNKEEKD